MVDEERLGGPAIPRRRGNFTRRQVLAQSVVAVVILASGIAIGTGGTILAIKDKIARIPLTTSGPNFPPINSERPVGRWTVELDLTGEQAGQMKTLFEDSVKAARDRWLKLWEAEQAERAAFAKSVKDVLTPEQYAKWEKELIDREQHFRRGGPGGPGGPGRPGGPGGRDGRGGPDRWRGPRGQRGPDSDPNRPPQLRWDGRRDFGPNRPPDFQRRGFDPNRPPEFRRDGRRDFDSNRPPEFRRERPREFGPDGPPPESGSGQAPEPNQIGQHP